MPAWLAIIPHPYPITRGPPNSRAPPVQGKIISHQLDMHMRQGRPLWSSLSCSTSHTTIQTLNANHLPDIQQARDRKKGFFL